MPDLVLPDERDELIDAQKQVIGILFEVVKRLQRNNDLDQDYLQSVLSGRAELDATRLDRIKKERFENARIIGKLLAQLEI